MLAIQRGWDWDEQNGERAIPHVTKARSSDGLKPSPPTGWLKVFRYSSTPPVETTHAAAWMYCVLGVQSWERKNERVRRMHMICRDPEGCRVLVVHPNLADEVDEYVEGINSILIDCTCGGYDCLESTLQMRAAKLFARRALKCVDPDVLPELLREQELPPEILEWENLSIARRMLLVKYQRLDPDMVLDAQHWTDAVRAYDCSLFEALAKSLHEASGAPTWWEERAETSLLTP